MITNLLAPQSCCEVIRKRPPRFHDFFMKKRIQYPVQSGQRDKVDYFFSVSKRDLVSTRAGEKKRITFGSEVLVGGYLPENWAVSQVTPLPSMATNHTHTCAVTWVFHCQFSGRFIKDSKWLNSSVGFTRPFSWFSLHHLSHKICLHSVFNKISCFTSMI